MGTGRLEAFSDGVIAVIITITVLDLHLPPDPSVQALLRLTPLLLTYLVSFTVVGIMWVNHHHMMHLAKRVTAPLMWANNLLLFWMSLIPFATSYLGSYHTKPLAAAVYGVVMAACAASFTVLRGTVNSFHKQNRDLDAHNRRIMRKSMVGTVAFASAAILAFVSVYISFTIYVLIPASFFLPERKIAETPE